MILTLMHDYRIMIQGAKLSMQMPHNMPVPPAVTAFCKATMSTKAFRKVMWGVAFNAQEALEYNIVNETYTCEDEAEKVIKNFA